MFCGESWSGREDLNLGPLGPEPSAPVTISSVFLWIGLPFGNWDGNWKRRFSYESSRLQRGEGRPLVDADREVSALTMSRSAGLAGQ
jgi:hypothetical protein